MLKARSLLECRNEPEDRLGSSFPVNRSGALRPVLLRVVGHLPCDEVGRELDRQVSDKPQGRKPRENILDGLASVFYGDLNVSRLVFRLMIGDRWR